MRPRLLTVFRTAAALLSGLFLLTSCEEPVELNIDVPKSRLVINSNFFPGEPVRLRVSATRPVGTAAIPLTDAVVTLYEGDELAEELRYEKGSIGAGGGSYRTVKFRPQVGRQYTVHVSAAGYDPVTAVSSIPEPIPITALRIASLSSKYGNERLVYDYTLAVDYADPPSEVNYYDLRVYQRVTPFKLSAAGDTIRMAPYLKTVGTPDHQAEQTETISVLLQDRGSSGRLAVHLQSHLDPRKELLGEIVAELRTVSPEYYFFQRSLGPDQSGMSGGLYEPLILFNNVDSGLGIFAGYTAVQVDLQLIASF